MVIEVPATAPDKIASVIVLTNPKAL
jgi:hypothetical protein